MICQIGFNALPATTNGLCVCVCLCLCLWKLWKGTRKYHEVLTIIHLSKQYVKPKGKYWREERRKEKYSSIRNLYTQQHDILSLLLYFANWCVRSTHATIKIRAVYYQSVLLVWFSFNSLSFRQIFHIWILARQTTINRQ